MAGVLSVGAFTADAAGDAQVTFSSGTLTVTVPSGATGRHRFSVEPFREVGGRDGWRVLPSGSSGPFELAITTSDSDCFGNSFFNDVVCNGQRIAVAVTTRGGDDEVGVASQQQDVVVQCVTGVQLFADVATVNLGGGNDFMRTRSSSCAPGTAPEFGFSFHLVVNAGSGNDTISSTAGPDTLDGGPNADDLQGQAGDDTIVGGSGDDTIVGGPGRDSLKGEGGRDTLNSRDGERDRLVDCGPNDPGTPDIAIVDSGDVGATTPLFLLGQGSVIRNCEGIFASPIDDGPPGALLGTRLRIRGDGLTRVRIACPRAALVHCRGRVSVRDPKHLARALASASYAIRLGARKRVVLKLTAAERALLRRRGRAIVATKEQGRSSRGPRGARRTFGIAGS